MTVACFILYLVFFCLLINKISFFKSAELSATILTCLFILKIIAGLIYAWFYSKLPITSADTWNYFNLSKGETDVLVSHPFDFVKDFFTYGYSSSGNLFSGQNSYWNDIKSDAVIKLMAICNLFTATNYYADLIFFNFLFFFGPIAFFKVMMSYYAEKKWLLIISIFLLPSFLFWCSGMHKDGLLFSAIALVIYFFNKQLQYRKIILKYCIIIIFCFSVLFVFRNFLFFLILPALFCWYLASRLPKKKWLIFFTFYAVGLILFFIVPHISSLLNFPEYIITKQNEFKQLSGNSSIPLQILEPTVVSFFHFFPTALDISFLRPHFTDSKNFSYLFSATENIFIIFLMIIAIIFPDKKKQTVSLLLFCLFFSASVLLLSGYTVTFSGSIVRYKSVVLPLLVTFLTVKINWYKLGKLIYYKNKNI